MLVIDDTNVIGLAQLAGDWLPRMPYPELLVLPEVLLVSFAQVKAGANPAARLPPIPAPTANIADTR